MKAKIKWENGAQQKYHSLCLEAYEEVEQCIELLKLGKQIPNETSLLSIPDAKVAWFQSGYVLMFSRQKKAGYWKQYTVISIKHIAENDRLLPVEYFRTDAESNDNTTRIQQCTQVLDNAQRVGFSIQAVSVLTYILLALIVTSGSWISSRLKSLPAMEASREKMCLIE